MPFTPGRIIDETGDPKIDTRETWVNDRFQVLVYRVQPEGIPYPMVHLSIKRNSRNPIHDWRDLQRIKNELCGTNCEAAELYPAAVRETDLANQYHLWVLPPGVMFPFGFNDGRLVSSDSEYMERNEKYFAERGLVDNSKQRPFSEHHKEELPAIGPVWEGYEDKGTT
jgi:hypothetical protein